MSEPIPTVFLDMLDLADASWRPILRRGLQAVASADPAYLPALAEDTYLPTGGRLLAAFVKPLDAVRPFDARLAAQSPADFINDVLVTGLGARYVLVGEGPYPRPESATGVCFMDGAVGLLW